MTEKPDLLMEIEDMRIELISSLIPNSRYSQPPPWRLGKVPKWQGNTYVSAILGHLYSEARQRKQRRTNIILGILVGTIVMLLIAIIHSFALLIVSEYVYVEPVTWRETFFILIFTALYVYPYSIWRMFREDE